MIRSERIFWNAGVVYGFYIGRIYNRSLRERSREREVQVEYSELSLARSELLFPKLLARIDVLHLCEGCRYLCVIIEGVGGLSLDPDLIKGSMDNLLKCDIIILHWNVFDGS